MKRIPMINALEYDILRQNMKPRASLFCKEWLRRNASRVKRWYRRRERLKAKVDLSKEISEYFIKDDK